jgi:type I restriction-modification system DNA methylase subunit
MDTKNTKREKGQYFTQTNPFTLPAFKKWTSFLPNNATILEPFAGANNIVKMLNNINPLFSFASFDILPNNNINMFSKVNVVKQDTLKKMPTGYDCIVTNPPYLAKNSATRRGKENYGNNKYDDI